MCRIAPNHLHLNPVRLICPVLNEVFTKVILFRESKPFIAESVEGSRDDISHIGGECWASGHPHQ